MLIKWTADSNHNFALRACETLTMIYTEQVLVEKNHLKMFVDSVQSTIRGKKKKAEVNEAELIGFYLENEIKEYYREFINNLTRLLESTLTYVKKSCIKLLCKLARFQELRRKILS